MLMKEIYNTVCEKKGYKETPEKTKAWETLMAFLEGRGITCDEFEDLINEFDAEAQFEGFCLGFISGVEIMVSKN